MGLFHLASAFFLFGEILMGRDLSCANMLIPAGRFDDICIFRYHGTIKICVYVAHYSQLSFRSYYRIILVYLCLEGHRIYNIKLYYSHMCLAHVSRSKYGIELDKFIY